MSEKTEKRYRVESWIEDGWGNGFWDSSCGYGDADDLEEATRAAYSTSRHSPSEKSRLVDTQTNKVVTTFYDGREDDLDNGEDAD